MTLSENSSLAGATDIISIMNFKSQKKKKFEGIFVSSHL